MDLALLEDPNSLASSFSHPKGSTGNDLSLEMAQNPCYILLSFLPWAYGMGSIVILLCLLVQQQDY